MNDMTPTSEERAAKLEGMGCKRKRVEDIRFVQGKGNYVDDLKLPNMLYGDFYRTPHAHARIVSIESRLASVSATASPVTTVSLAWPVTAIADDPSGAGPVLSQDRA